MNLTIFLSTGALLFFTAEVFLGTLGVSAALTRLFPEYPHLLQVSVFFGLSVVLCLEMSQILTRSPRVPADAVGSPAQVVSVRQAGGIRVSYRGTECEALLDSPDGVTVKEDDTLKVFGVSGTRLVCRPTI